MSTALDARWPVTLLTGWLGAGKTTLLNRLLSEPEGRRYAVLVNEFGAIGVDDRLVVRSDEDLVELQNGCVCCTVRGDLVEALHRLRRPRGLLRRRRPVDHVLIETTGIAEPAPLLRTFLLEEGVAEGFRVASVVTLVDAQNHEAALAERAAREQIAVADLIGLNKVDLAVEEELVALGARLATLNPTAVQRRVEQAALSNSEVLRERPLAPEALRASRDEDDAAAHVHGLGSVSLVEDRPLDELKVQLWLGACVRMLGPRLVRYKGFLHLQGHDRRTVLQGVYDLFTAEPGEPWGDDTPRTELVFIGHDLEAGFFERGLSACLLEG